MPPLAATAAPESPRVRLAFTALAAAVIAVFVVATHPFWVPAHPGDDQNAYLVSGKLLATHFPPGLAVNDPYVFVGKMWVAAPDGRYYSKYPLGMPALVALALKVFGPAQGTRMAYWISPAAMALALAGLFLLVRQVAGSFAGLLGVIALAASPAVLLLTNSPNSHAATLCAATWGMLALLSWWRRPTFPRAVLAGLLLGAAATFRYTEGLLLLPLALAALFNLDRRSRRSLAQTAVLLASWLALPALQIVYNHRVLHSLTAYDATRESTAFGWAHFARNGWTTVRQLSMMGLWALLPVAVLGLIALFARSWRLAAVMLAWLLPGTLLYTAYYYGAIENDGDGYIRFFLSVFPPLVLGAVWYLTRRDLEPGVGSQRLLRRLAALVVVLGGAAYCVHATLPMLRTDHRSRVALERTAWQVLAAAPAGSVIFGPQPELLHLQFAGDYRLYSRNLFVRRAVEELGTVDPSQPNTLQPQRALDLYARLKDSSPADLLGLQRELAVRALAAGQRVFVIAPSQPGPAAEWLRFAGPGDTGNPENAKALALRTLASWDEPEPEPGSDDGYPEMTLADWRLVRRQGRLVPRTGWQLIEVTQL
ncbi:MAG: glycosyltransferase family 39 protein [Acidobacteria bacterium]|nr:glycosyltransferase family 39 protein [Acidobacteriota bacterium]